MGDSASRRLFNADLTLLDDKRIARPLLAETFPQLHTEAWRVSPDDRMETTYRCKPTVAWQDGRPPSTEDFVFA